MCLLICIPFLSAAISTSNTVSAISSSVSVSVEVLFRAQDQCNPLFCLFFARATSFPAFSLQKKPCSRDIALIRTRFNTPQGPIRSFTER